MINRFQNSRVAVLAWPHNIHLPREQVYWATVLLLIIMLLSACTDPTVPPQVGVLNKVIGLKGTPTIMIGDVDDPHFEEHLQEGPYIVFDDAAKPEYKNDPRVYFVSATRYFAQQCPN